MVSSIMDGLQHLMEYDLNEFLENFYNPPVKQPVTEESGWIQLEPFIPEWDEHYPHRTIEDINVIYQSPSKRRILDISKDDENAESLALYISDLLEKTIHRYNTRKMNVDAFIGGYLLTETHMVIMELQRDTNNFIQHFVLLDHTEKTLTPKGAYFYPADPLMDDHEVVASPLIVNKNAYCVLKGIGMFQFIPFWPKTNPFDEPAIPSSFVVEYDDFRIEDYSVQKDDATVCGKYMFMIIDGIYIDNDYHERSIIDVMACIDLSHRSFKGTFNIDEHNRAAVELVNFTKTNFDEVEYQGLNYYMDANLLVYIKDDEKERPVPYYVVNMEARTVIKVNTCMSNHGFPLKYDNAVLQIRFRKWCTGAYIENGNSRRRRREVENIFEFKIIRYNMPTLFQLCRDFIISTDLTKNFSEQQKSLLF